MPTISLRLTEEEHAALKAWAHDSRRSLQKEAVWRLFAEREEESRIEVRDGTGRVVQVLDAGQGKIADQHFKPDFKGGKK